MLLLSEVDRNELTPRVIVTAAVDESLSVETIDKTPAQATGIRQAPLVDLPVVDHLCYSIGPLADLAEITTMRSWLAARNGVLELREDERRELALYWVFFPPMKDRNAASQRVARLRALGVDDIYIIPRGDMANAISLGVFSHKTSLERRLSELRSKGFDPSVEPRYKTKKAAWFDVVVPVEAPIAVSEFTRSFENAELLPTRCRAEQIASNPEFPYNPHRPRRQYFYSDTPAQSE